jgi:hypothetical protein
VSRDKVITEITIETSQVLVVTRRLVSRFRCSECGSEAESARQQDVKAQVEETGNQHGVEALFSPHLSKAVAGSPVVDRRSLLGAKTLGATTLAKRFIDCFRRGGKRKSETQE